MRLLLPCVFAYSLTLLCILVLSSLPPTPPGLRPRPPGCIPRCRPAASAGVRVWDAFLRRIGLQARCSATGGPSRGALLAPLRARLPTRGHPPGWCPPHFVWILPPTPSVVTLPPAPPPRGGGLCAELPSPTQCSPMPPLCPRNGFRTELFRRRGRDRRGKEKGRRRPGGEGRHVARLEQEARRPGAALRWKQGKDG